jgi:conjugation system TraG family ATPase
MKKNVFDNPYFAIAETAGIAILYNKTGETSIIIQYQNLAEQFGADQDQYTNTHQMFSAILKSMGSDLTLQKTDIIFTTAYQPVTGKEDLLSNKYHEHFKGRPYKKILSYLILTAIPKKGNFFTYNEREFENFTTVAGKVFEILGAYKCSPSYCSSAEINELTRRLMVMNFTDKALSVNNFRKPKSEDYIEYADKIIKCVALVDIDHVDLPASVSPYNVRNELSPGFPVDPMTFLFDLQNCDTVVYNQVVSIPEQQKTKIRLELKKKRHSSIPDAANTIAMEDIDQLMIDIAKSNSLLVNSHYSIIFKCDADQAKTVYNFIENKLFDNQIVPSKSAYNQIELFRGALPGNANELKEYDKFLTTSDAAICFFLKECLVNDDQSDFKIYFTDRQGVPVAVDTNELPKQTQRIANTNKFVLGPSGSGKSFFMNHLCRHYALYGADIVLVDTGHSYAGLCKYLGGTYISYTDEKPITMNPFLVDEREYNEEKRDFLKTMIGLLWKGTDGKLSQVEDTVLNKTISDFYQQHFADPDRANKPLSFNAFYDYCIVHIESIIQENQITFDLSEYKFVLRKFYAGGEYQHLLNSSMDESLFHEKFIVFEIDSIKESKVLFPIVTIIIMDVFLQKMRLKANYKALIIEEAWKAIASPMMAGYILFLYKTVRKFRGECVVVTQEIDDILNNPIVKESIISNSDTIIMLDQSKFKDNFSKISAFLNLNKVEQNKIFTINRLDNKQRRGRFKEVYIKTGATGRVYGVEVSIFEYIAFSTERPEK